MEPFMPNQTPPTPMPAKQKKKISIPIILLSILCLIFLSVCIFLAAKLTNMTKETSAPVLSEEEDPITEKKGEQIILDDIKARLASGNTVLSVLKDYYPDNIVYVDNGRYIFSEIQSNLAKNTFDKGEFRKDSNNEITYSENDTIISHKGIDVSQFQGTIDFSKVKAAGVEYAIIRCGYRGYGSGALVEDPTFTDNIEGALQNDIKVGVYFFTQAISKDEAVEEADYVINKIKPYNVTYPIVIDVEEIVGDSYRQQNLTKSELTDVIIAFCDRVKDQGYTPMIYGNLKCLIGKIDLSRLESYEKWFAYYADEPYYPYAMSMWQYSESGTIDGIEGNVDLNISFKTW